MLFQEELVLLILDIVSIPRSIIHYKVEEILDALFYIFTSDLEGCLECLLLGVVLVATLIFFLFGLKFAEAAFIDLYEDT